MRVPFPAARMTTAMGADLGMVTPKRPGKLGAMAEQFLTTEVVLFSKGGIGALTAFY
jgi:hypothetical protein